MYSDQTKVLQLKTRERLHSNGRRPTSSIYRKSHTNPNVLPIVSLKMANDAHFIAGSKTNINMSQMFKPPFQKTLHSQQNNLLFAVL